MQPSRNEASKALALDIMLRTFMNSTEFQNLKFKNWESIAKLIPGTTAKQCSHRWEELKACGGSVTGDYSGLTALGRPLSSSHSSSLAHKPPRGAGNMEQRSLKTSTSSVLTSEPQSYQSRMHRSKSDIGFRLQPSQVQQTVHREMGQAVDVSMDAKHEEKEQLPKATLVKSVNGVDGPSIVVHVCDEAKNVKKDFMCPRDLLVKEMYYFADYLSSGTHHYDDVDISVHCDIGIFDWLMQYVKRGLLEDTAGNFVSEPLKKPSFKPGNVISILISSNFLKMPNLVEECLTYCHDHMSEIVQLPCNMSCLNDELLSRLANKFTIIECEDLLDKKDRVKNKLFANKIQQLFEPTFSTNCSPNNASTLYRCQHCHTLLTTDQSSKLPCALERLFVDCKGKISFKHERDPSWDVNNYLISLKDEGLNWRVIFWRLWGIVNDLCCSECAQVFQCGSLATCPYHPQSTNLSVAGPTYYLCCRQSCNAFNTLSISKSGCRLRDHTVKLADNNPSVASQPPSLSSHSAHHISKFTTPGTRVRQKSAPSSIATPTNSLCRRNKEDRTNCTKIVYDILIAHRDVICSEKSQTDLIFRSNSMVNIFQQEYGKTQSRPSTASTVNSDSITTTSCLSRETSQSSVRSTHQHQRNRTKGRRHHQEECYSDVEEDEVELHSVSSQMTDDENCANWKWDTSKTKLWNEDTQRKHDEKMLKAVLSARLAMASQQGSHPAQKKTFNKRKEVSASGIYAKLEAQFRASMAARSQNGMTVGSNRMARDKRHRPI